MKKIEIWEQVLETFLSLFENFCIKTVFFFYQINFLDEKIVSYFFLNLKTIKYFLSKLPNK